ncbi:MAG: hypothetical protein NXI16_08660 [Alphaproteobacteria bacterium]|nr:hypothetical protein [Alphaproteobacteria bacterium]
MTALQQRFPLDSHDLINPESRVPLRPEPVTLEPHEIARLMQQGRIERSLAFRDAFAWMARWLRGLVA